MKSSLIYGSFAIALIAGSIACNQILGNKDGVVYPIETIAPDVSGPTTIVAANDGGVYWTTSNAMNLGSGCTGQLQGISSGGSLTPFGLCISERTIAVDANNIYGSQLYQIFATELSNSSATTTVTAVGGDKQFIALQDGMIYFVDELPNEMAEQNFQIESIPANSTDGSSTTLYSSGKDMYVSATAMAVDSEHVYVAATGASSSAIISVPITSINLMSGAPTLKDDASTSIFADSDGVYWTTTKGELHAQIADNFQVLATNQSDPRGVTADAHAVYWANAGDGTIRFVSKQGGAVSTLVSGENRPVAIAVDSVNVYWANYGTADAGVGGSIRKMQKLQE